MAYLLRSISECGWVSWLCLFCGATGLLSGGVAALLGALKHRTAANVLGGLTLGLGVLAVVIGLAGKLYGQRRVDEIVASGNISPDQRERIRTVGLAEAGQCLSVGLGASAAPLLLGTLALVLGLSLQRPPSS